MQDRQFTIRIGIFSLVISAILILWLLLPFRISNHVLDQIVAMASVWIILITLAIACDCLLKYIWLRILGALPFSLLALALPILIVFSMGGGGPLTGYEVLDSVKMDHSTVVAYRTNGGATMPFGITITQEMPIFTGIVLEKDLYSSYGESSATLRLTGDNSILAIVENVKMEFKVHPFIFF